MHSSLAHSAARRVQVKLSSTWRSSAPPVARKEPFDLAIQHALQAVLVSPHFLFRRERLNPDPGPRLTRGLRAGFAALLFSLGKHARQNVAGTGGAGQASGSRNAEGTGDAHPHSRHPRRDEDKVRIVPDAKLAEFATRFVEQWLGTRELGRDIRPDPKLFPQYQDAEIQAAIRYQPILFFQELMASNLSLLNLLDSKFTFLNSALDRHYGLKIPKLRQQPTKQDLPDEQPSRRTAGHGGGRGRIVVPQSHQPGPPWQMGARSAAWHSASATSAECAGA